MFTGDFVPMVYPIDIRDPSLRDSLRTNKIYTAQYWPESRNRIDSQESLMLENYVYLSVDQRLGIGDLERIVTAVNSANLCQEHSCW